MAINTMDYVVYIVECSDKSLYCGYTSDLDKRIEEHNISNKGAKYTKSRRPVKLIYSEPYSNISDALKRECSIKKLSRSQKLELISHH